MNFTPFGTSWKNIKINYPIKIVCLISKTANSLFAIGRFFLQSIIKEK